VVAGVVAAGLELGWVRQLTEENQFFDSGYVIIFSRSGRLLTHPDPKVVFSETMESLAQKTGNPELLQIYQRIAANRQGAFSYKSNSLQKRVHENYKPVQLAGWGVVVGFYESEFLSKLSAYRWITTVSLAVMLILLASVVVLAIGLALQPLSMLTDVSLEISRGNLDLEIAAPRRKDEIGQLHKAFIVMREALRKNRELEAKVRERTQELAAANESLKSEVIERRWVNHSLEHQLRYDRLIINSINDMVVVCTKALNISRVNPAVIHKTGFQPAELVDSPLSRIVKLDSESSSQGGLLVNPLLQSLKDGRDMRNEPAVIMDRAGKTTKVQISLFPIRDKDLVVGGVAILQVAPPDAASH
jgi:PAS domain S-box-containing protein